MLMPTITAQSDQQEQPTCLAQVHSEPTKEQNSGTKDIWPYSRIAGGGEIGITFCVNPADCNQYIGCWDSQFAMASTCPDNMHFTEKLKKCVPSS